MHGFSTEKTKYSKTLCASLCGNPLPWVESGKHLGTKIENKVRSILGQDMNEKRAQCIQRNNELMQEFAFADCVTKTKINSIYNSHFHGYCGTYLGLMLNAYIRHGTHQLENCSDYIGPLADIL